MQSDDEIGDEDADEDLMRELSYPSASTSSLVQRSPDSSPLNAHGSILQLSPHKTPVGNAW